MSLVHDENEEDSEEDSDMDELSTDTSPFSKITQCLILIQTSTQFVSNGGANIGMRPTFRDEVGRKIIEFLREDPLCARRLFNVGSTFLPLMHWVCRLKLPRDVVKAIHEANPDACKTLHPNNASGTLPLYQAMHCGNLDLDMIRLLIECNPDSGTADNLGKLFWTSDPHTLNDVVSLLQSVLSQSDLVHITSSGTIRWDHTSPFPLHMLEFIIDVHDLKSINVKGIAWDYNSGVTIFARRNHPVLDVEITCDKAFDFTVEELLGLSIPLTSLEVDTLDNPDAIKYLVATISPSVLNNEDDNRRRDEEYARMRHSMQQLGLTYAPQHDTGGFFYQAVAAGLLPLPGSGAFVENLDLSDVEQVSVRSIIRSAETMSNLVSGLGNLPKLKALVLDSSPIRSEAVHVPHADSFRELPSLADRLEELKIIALDTSLSSVCSLVKRSTKFKRLEFFHFNSSPVDTVEIVESLKKNKSMERLALGSLDREGAASLIRFLRENATTIKEFEGINDCPFAHEINYWCRFHHATLSIQDENTTKKQAVSVYIEHSSDLPLLYELLRYRVALWCVGIVPE